MRLAESRGFVLMGAVLCVSAFVVGATTGCSMQSGSKTSLYAGNQQYRSAQYGKAVAEYSKAIREAAGRGRFGRELLAQAYLNRGAAFEQMGRRERAVADYTEAVSIAFSSPAPYLQRAAAYGKLEQYEKAVADYTEAISLGAGNARTYCQRALAYGKLGKAGLAAQDAQTIACLQPGSSAPRQIMAALRAEAASSQAPSASRHYAAGGCFKPAAAGEWAFSLTPYVWVPDVRGAATVQGVKTPANWGRRETFRNLDWTTAARFEAWRDKWGIIVDGFYVKTGGSNNHPLVAARSVNITAELITVDVAGSYRLVDVFVGKGADDGEGRKYPRFIFEPIVGARFVYLNQEVEINPNVGRVRDSTTYFEPFVGGRAALDVTEHVSLQIRGDIGGFSIGEASDKTWTLMPGVVWRVSDLISLNAAYRITAMDFTKDTGTDTFANDTTLRGPLVGVGFNF